MKSVRKLYFYYTINRTNIIILGVSIFILFIIFNLYDFDIPYMDYEASYEEFHKEYVVESLSTMIPISIVVIMLVMSIDYMTNHKRFDLIFSSRVTPRQILRIKLGVYLVISLIYITAIYVLMMLVGTIRFEGFKFSFLYFKLYAGLLLQMMMSVFIISIIMRLTKTGYSAIIVLILYFMSMIIGDYNKYIANMIFVNINMEHDVIESGLFLPMMMVVLYAIILDIVMGKRELK